MDNQEPPQQRSLQPAAVRFRWHRGSLEDSLATECVIADRAALAELIQSALSPAAVQPDDITIEFYAHDDRLGRDAYIVKVGGKPVGFTDAPL